MFGKRCIIGLLVLTLMMPIFLATTSFAEMETVTANEPLPMPRLVKDRPLHFAYIIADLSSSGRRVWRQVQNEVVGRGWKVTPILDASSLDLQASGMRSFIEKDVDAIIINGMQMEPLMDIIIEARELGIGVYNCDTPLRPGVIANVTQPNGVVGAQMFYYGMNRLNGKGNMLIFSHPPHILRRRCFSARGLVEDDWPGLKLVGFEDLGQFGWEKKVFDVTSNYIQRYGADLSWIFAGWDSPGILATRAVEQAGYTKDEIFVTGIDGGPESYAEIRKGSPFVATMSQPLEQYLHMTCEIIKQVQIDGIGPGELGSMVPPWRTIFCTPVLTDATNLPEPGQSIHEVFGATYYDPDNPNGWWNWGTPPTL